VFKNIDSVELILDPSNKEWILGKIANRLEIEFSSLGIKCEVLSKPMYLASVVLWIHYGDKTINFEEIRKYSSLPSSLVTHVDDSLKLARVRKLYSRGLDLVFMSKEHASKIANFIGMDSPPFNILVGSDLAIPKNLFKVGIVSRCYPDGRKNEEWLLDFANQGLLEEVELTIIGTGWGKIVRKLRGLGVLVLLFDDHENRYPEYSEIIDAMQEFNLFLNFGFDEGSMGALDGFLLGKDVLISHQGFHLEFGLSDDNYVLNLPDAREKFRAKKIAFFDKQQRVRGWAWSTMAQDLLNHWESDSVLPPSFTGTRKLGKLFVIESLRMLFKTLRRVFLIRAPRKLWKLINAANKKLWRP
jgi:hypothetical protein